MPEAASQSGASPPDRPLSPALDKTFKISLVQIIAIRFSVGLTALTVFDAFLAWLTWREYRSRKTPGHPATGR